MTISLVQSAPGAPAEPAKGAAAFGLDGPRDYMALIPFRDLISVARIYVKGPGQPDLVGPAQYPRDPETWLPSEIPAGYDRLEVLFAWASQVSGSPQFGRYALRHNLPGTYSLSFREVSNVRTVSYTRTEFDVTYPAGNWWFTISGPPGPLPAGWFLELLKLTDEAAYDNAGLSLGHRRYRQAYLDEIRRCGPSLLRNMDPLHINNDLKTVEVADFAPDTARTFGGAMTPLNLICALHNEVRADCWFNIHARASDALILHCAEYLRDNLDSPLKIYAEYCNEVWNFQFAQTSVASATGIKLLDAQGPGTVSVTNGSGTITAAGVDLRTIMGNSGASGSDRIVVGDLSYPVDRNTVTETTATMKWGATASESLSEAPWWYATTGNIRNNHGYRILATNVMEIFRTAFAATPDRLVRVLGTQLVNTGVTNTLLDDSYWSGDAKFVPSEDAFDVLAGNFYFGSSFFNDQPIKAEIARLYNEGDSEGWRNFYADLLFERNPSFSQDRTFRSIETATEAQLSLAKTKGLQFISYEGGTHIVHGGTVGPDDTEILDSFTDFLSSPQATEVFNYWRDLHVRFLDGPVMQFGFSGYWGRYGFWGAYPEFAYAGDSRTAVLEGEKGRAPWWLPEYPPRWAQIPAQSWSSGQSPEFDLSGWSSVNTMAWEGTPPLGTSLDPMTGIISGIPLPGAGSYTFTATNASGSAEITVPINVS